MSRNCSTVSILANAERDGGLARGEIEGHDADMAGRWAGDTHGY